MIDMFIVSHNYHAVILFNAVGVVMKKSVTEESYLKTFFNELRLEFIWCCLDELFEFLPISVSHPTSIANSAQNENNFRFDERT